MRGSRTEKGWESKQKAYGQEVDVLGAKLVPEETSQALWHGNELWVIEIIFRAWVPSQSLTV